MLKTLLVHIPSERPIRPVVDGAVSLAMARAAHLDAVSVGYESANVGLAIDGGAVFFDMGRTWGTDVTGATSDGLLMDVGIGLRLGSSRSAFGNVIHVDLAFPLDGDADIDSVQFVVETKARF